MNKLKINKIRDNLNKLEKNYYKQYLLKLIILANMLGKKMNKVINEKQKIQIKTAPLCQ